MPKLKVYKGGPGSGHYGHAGRPGKRGGSLGGSVAMSIRTGRDAAERQAAASRAGKQTGPKPGTPGQPGPEHIERYRDEVYFDEKIQDHIIGVGGSNEIATHSKNAQMASDEIRSGVKAQLVDDIYDKIPSDQRYDAKINPEGISKDDVNQMVKQWAYESNDNSIDSLSMQQAASKEFGIELSEFQNGKIHAMQTRVGSYPTSSAVDESGNFIGVNNMKIDNQRVVLRSMYENTQSQLAEMGYKPGDTITVFRGLHINKDFQGVKMPATLPQGTMNYTDNVMASWSTQWNVAENFTSHRASNVLSQKVPIENILSTSRTGFGALTEAEIVVLASPGTQVTVTDVGR